MAFSPDGKWLASASDDGTVKVENITATTLINRVASVSSTCKRFIFSIFKKLIVEIQMNRLQLKKDAYDCLFRYIFVLNWILHLYNVVLFCVLSFA